MYLFKIYTPNELVHLHKVLSPVFENWAKDWFDIENRNFQISNELSETEYRENVRDALFQKGLLFIDHGLDAFKALIGDKRVASEMKEENEISRSFVEQICRLYLTDLVDRINRNKTISEISEQCFKRDFFKPGRGAIIVRYSIGQFNFILVMDQILVIPLLKMKEQVSEPLEKLSESELLAQCHDKPITLTAEFADIELTLEEFSDLSKGDVIIFNKSVKDKINLKTVGGQHICMAKVGINDGKRALRLSN